jgi:hypothetical protein
MLCRLDIRGSVTLGEPLLTGERVYMVLGSREYPVAVTQDGRPAKGSVVELRINDEVIASGTTGRGGVVNLTMPLRMERGSPPPAADIYVNGKQLRRLDASTPTPVSVALPRDTKTPTLLAAASCLLLVAATLTILSRSHSFTSALKP